MKNIVVFLAFAALASGARSEWLWWTLDFTSDASHPWTAEEGAPSTAWLVVKSGTGESTTIESVTANDYSYSTLDWTEDSYTFKSALTSENLPAGLLDAITASGSAYQFYVELGNALGTPLWTSATGLSYHDAATTVKALSTVASMNDANLNPWAPTGWTSPGEVPEPTSGLLVVMGMGFLALRRRKGFLA